MTLVKNNNFNYLLDELFNPQVFKTRETYAAFGSIPANISEDEQNYYVELLAPGRTKEDIKLEINKDVLQISYEAKEPINGTTNLKTLRKEFALHSFKRSFHIDEKIDTENITAKYENGILQIQLPKKAVVIPSNKQISIS